ncbi:MAG TPA: type III-A CRISPR-associated protein Csm2 [Methylococcus sp.]|nr:type III-A CRISPR-associated protein Csm2 [Methylococcus sp.]
MAQQPDHNNRNPQQRQQHHQQQVAMAQIQIKLSKPLDPELFNDVALKAAKTVANADRDRNKATQLRRFYDELMLWESRTAQQPDKFGEYLPFIRMLNAKAAYAEGRKLVDRTFVELLRQTLAEVKDAETLTTCKLFWEAFMGFYKQERPN